jgi:hypothetical protein
MSRASAFTALMLSTCLAITGCTAGTCASSGAPSYEEAIAEPGPSKPLAYVGRHGDLARYNRFMVDPVRVYAGRDNGFGSASFEDRRTMAEFVRAEVVRALREGYAVVTAPGPDVARIRLVLVGMEKTTTDPQAFSSLNAFGLVLNRGREGATGEGGFMGSITLAWEFLDSRTDATITAFTARMAPDSLDKSQPFSEWGASRKAATRFAAGLRASVDEAHASVPR